MPRFFIRQNQIEDGLIHIKGDDARHISRALRMAAGEKITVCDMQSKEYECELVAFTDDEDVTAKILSVKESENEPFCKVTLFQALPKGDKLDTVIQKAVECGVSEIVPFESERCIAKIKGEAEDKKYVRRNRISAEAAKQCGRSLIPEVKKSVGFENMVELALKSEFCLFCYEGDGTEPLGKVIEKIKSKNGKIPESISVIIGSEGGFSIDEAQKCTNKGMIPTGLGRRILRTETASTFVLSCLVCHFELI